MGHLLLERLGGAFQEAPRQDLLAAQLHEVGSRRGPKGERVARSPARSPRCKDAPGKQVGGEVALVQDLSLTLQINDGFTNSVCLFTNAQAQVKSPWPEIQTQADQSNGTFLRLYRLKLHAAPVPQFRSVTIVTSTASLRLEWESYGGGFVAERAPAVDGPYSAITSNVTAQAFEDVGVLTKAVRYYYRLRQ